MKKNITLCILLLLLATAGLFTAVCAGAKPISLQVVADSIFHFDGTLEALLVRDSRLPRALASALVGGMLALAGALMQGITRNPLAEPSIMGMTQGATLAVAICSVNLSVYSMLGNTLAALIGAFLSGILVLLFSLKTVRTMNTSVLLIAGTAISTFFISLASIIALLGNRSQDLAFWLSGGFRTASWDSVFWLLIIGSCSLVFSGIMAKNINLVSLGDEVALGLGVKPTRVRIYSLAMIIPICAVCVAVAGSISFVGLVIPHVVRRVVGNNHGILIPFSFLAGAVLMIWADIAAKTINMPYEIPVGLFSACIGVPFFIYLVRREKT